MSAVTNWWRKRIRRQNWRSWVGIILSLAALSWLVMTTDWPAAGAALRNADYRLVVAALLLNLIIIPLRALRWRYLFPPARCPRFLDLNAAMLIGQAVNIIAPARLGDLVRATLIRDQPTAFVLGTQVVQSALDLLMLAMLVIFMLLQVTLPSWWRGSGVALLWTTMAALLLIAGMVIFRRRLVQIFAMINDHWTNRFVTRIIKTGTDFLESLDTFDRPAHLTAALLLSALIWLAYGVTNYLLLRALSPQPTMLAALFVLIVLQLSVAVPSSPGRVGVFHYLGAQALLVFAYDDSVAVSFALLLHFISIIVPVLIGLLLAWRLGVSWGPVPASK